MMTEAVCVHVIISGRVQGVFFRMETRQAAQRLEIEGWVKNIPDGTVEAVFKGSQGQVKAMLNWCRHGPPSARVADLTIQDWPCESVFDGFEVRY